VYHIFQDVHEKSVKKMGCRQISSSP